jgi:hypothetical protein
MKTFRFQTSVSVSSAAPPHVVYETVTDLRAHIVWSGERAADDGFKLLTMDAPEPSAQVGTSFSSTGANFNGTFHDRSVVTEGLPAEPLRDPHRGSTGAQEREAVGGPIHPPL